VAFTIGTLLNGLRLRQRLSQLGRLDADPEPSDPAADADDFVVLCLPGVAVDPTTRAAAVRYAEQEGLDVVDLIPADLAADDALDLARAVDTTAYRSAPLIPGRGGRHAVVVRRAVADRMGAQAPADRAAFVTLTERLKQHAARSTDLAVAAGLTAEAPSRGERIAELKAMYNAAYPVALGLPAARSSFLLAGLGLSPGWGLAALGAYLAQPYLATGGSPLRPPMSPLGGARRVTEPLVLAGQAMAGARARSGAGSGPPAEDPVEARRAAYTAELALGLDRFYEPRRNDCPWCASTALLPLLRTSDLVQFKPGQFVIEECMTCGLLFQNPRLSLAGLDFYYRDMYDGLGGAEVEFLFAQAEPSYRGRVELARRHGSPRNWLDVGSGYGHFCVVARGLLPDTRFDGLDMGEGIEEAERRGWIDTAYRGMFPDLIEELKGRYDVVSMHHYLEHTRDPRAEIEAARTVLEPGGLLLVEVPDPDSRPARIFGKYWVAWLQPQHQQFLSVTHLTAAMEVSGFAVVEVERGAAHQPMDLAGAAWQWATALAGAPRVPWREPPTTGQRLRRAAVLTALAPVALAGLAADRILQPVVKARGEGWSNTYRVLARRL
jgi:SAM-dependent methyltransferase